MVNNNPNPALKIVGPLGGYMPDSEEVASITYSVKELLSDIRGSLGRLEGKLDAKADRSEVAELIRRVDSESNRITAIETHINTQTKIDGETKEWKRFIYPTILSVVVVVISLLAWLNPVK